MKRTVLITGASQGIGAATALAFAKQGYDVGINYYKTPQGAEETASLARRAGAQAEIFKADVSIRDEAVQMVESFIERFGKIDVLVNNAGGALKMPKGGFHEMPMDYWDSQVMLNLNAAVYCSHAAVKDMRAKGTPGRIINISSIHSSITWVRRKALPYSAAKAGLEMFTKSLGVEVAQQGINVNCIAPGLFLTGVVNRYSKEDMEAFLRKIPAGFAGTVDDITPLILFLADVKNTRFIQGQTFVVDGGQSIDGAIDYMLDMPI